MSQCITICRKSHKNLHGFIALWVVVAISPHFRGFMHSNDPYTYSCYTGTEASYNSNTTMKHANPRTMCIIAGWKVLLDFNLCSFHRRSKRKNELGWSNAGQSERNVSSFGQILRRSCLRWPDHISYATSAFLWGYMATWMVPRHVLIEPAATHGLVLSWSPTHVYRAEWGSVLLYHMSHEAAVLLS